METFVIFGVILVMLMSAYVGFLGGRVAESSERASEAKESYIKALEDSLRKK